MTAAAICGLAAEARIARPAGLLAMATGGDPARTAAAVEALLAAGALGVVSFGIAGGLDPALAPGSLLLPHRVRDEDGAIFPVDAVWREDVLAALARLRFHPHDGDLVGAGRAVTTAAAKAALFRSTAAAAVDLESHIVARMAARAGRSFLALRVVADPAARNLPPAAAIALDETGRPALGRILLCIARRPGQIAGLLHIARDARRALAVLARAASAVQA